MKSLEKLMHEKETQWPSFFNVVNKELSVVEENLIYKLPTKSNLLTEIIRYILKAGGKRFRPVLCLLIAKSTGSINENHIILAELTELIHTASLVHDDIIDSANLRRGRETINSLWNDKISVITGDFLFAQASIRLGLLENTEIVKIYAKVLSDLCEGEIEQYSFKFNTNISWDYYIHKSNTKTASLFAALCKSAAIINSQDKKTIDQAKDFGTCLGIAFQIVDDILDFTSSKKKIGKEIGADLKQGIITAPTIFALSSTDKRVKQLKDLIENQFNNKEEDFNKAIGLTFELGGCEKAKQLATDYITKAKNNLSFVQDLNLKTSLEQAADYIFSRIE